LKEFELLWKEHEHGSDFRPTGISNDELSLSNRGLMPKLTIRPLTPDLWPALEDLFGENGACNGCWCMYPRIGSAYRKRPRIKNKRAFQAIVMQGPPPGLLAFDDGVCVGWCQLTPRDDIPWFDRIRHLERVDDVPVWSISCLYIRLGHRRRGVSTALVSAAIRVAKRSHARALEAYPFDAALSPSSSSTGCATTFARLGFKIVARRIPARPIMRYEFQRGLRDRGAKPQA
jgi:GNAT superfamily N-acetyltransferase